MKWEEQSKEMVGTFIHKFTSPAIEQLLHSGKEKIVRYRFKFILVNLIYQIIRAISPSPPGSREATPEPEESEPVVKQRRVS